MMTTTRRIYTEAERKLSRVLLATWDEADRKEDDETIELCKAALTALGLPWVRI
jgi:hypothetical protein